MSTAAQRVAPDIVRETPERETVLRDTARPLPLSWPRRFLRSLTKGELLIVPVGHKGDEKGEYAQRWPAQAIASTVVSSMAIVVMVVFSLFNNYSSSTREDSKAFSDLQIEVIKMQGENNLLKSELERLQSDRQKDERDINTLKLALGLDIADGSRKNQTPKER